MASSGLGDKERREVVSGDGALRALSDRSI